MDFMLEFKDLINAGVVTGSAFFALLVAFGKILLSQINTRFKEQEQRREASERHWDTKFKELKDSITEESHDFKRIDRELMAIKAELPVNYVRRDDFIRLQTMIENKLDSLEL